MNHPTLQQNIDKAWDTWHAYLAGHEAHLLDELLDEEVVFHSPVVWTPQKGKALTKLYLLSAAKVLLDEFQYIRSIRQDLHWCLEFNCKIGDVTVRGIDLITLNEEGKIIDFEVMVRPLKAVNAIHQAMGLMLEQVKEKGSKP